MTIRRTLDQARYVIGMALIGVVLSSVCLALWSLAVSALEMLGWIAEAP